MRTDKLRPMKTTELSKQLEDAHQEQFNLRFRQATRQLADYSQLGKAKRNIARIKTVMRERELGR
ncbi:MAG: 50S ribosomal protein L29 [Chloroflexota bacterium]|nr:50S ribosomal protein L29 [Chloroflexota bacterium]